jgi:hypothetical protein
MKKLLILLAFVSLSSQAANLFNCAAHAEYENDYEILPNIRIDEVVSVSIVSHKYGNKIVLRSINGTVGQLGNGFVKYFKNGSQINFIDDRNDNYIDLNRKYNNIYEGRVILEEDFALLVRCRKN